MKDVPKILWLGAALVAGCAAGFVFASFALGIAVAFVLVMPVIVSIYIPYAKDNPNHFWFKRKQYGWGWTPVTWQGWLITIVYVALVVFFAMTIDGNSPREEVAFTFILPLVLLTTAFIRIAYKTGEKPRWQWGETKEK